MSIATNAELETAIGNYLARSDLSTYIPDFVRGAETRIAYGSADPFPSEPLRIRAMETAADIAVTSGTGALPSGFIGFRRLYWDSTPKRILEQTSPEDFYRKWTGSEQGHPSFYVIEGENIMVGPEGSGTIKALYYKKFDAIATASPVTWLLTNAPHAYVYGALLEAAPFIRNDPRLQVWHGMFRSVINSLNKADRMDRWGGSALAVRSDMGNP